MAAGGRPSDADAVEIGRPPFGETTEPCARRVTSDAGSGRPNAVEIVVRDPVRAG